MIVIVFAIFAVVAVVVSVGRHRQHLHHRLALAPSPRESGSVAGRSTGQLPRVLLMTISVCRHV
jgi:hypothetical protein